MNICLLWLHIRGGVCALVMLPTLVLRCTGVHITGLALSGWPGSHPHAPGPPWVWSSGGHEEEERPADVSLQPWGCAAQCSLCLRSHGQRLKNESENHDCSLEAKVPLKCLLTGVGFSPGKAIIQKACKGQYKFQRPSRQQVRTTQAILRGQDAGRPEGQQETPCWESTMKEEDR